MAGRLPASTFSIECGQEEQDDGNNEGDRDGDQHNSLREELSHDIDEGERYNNSSDPSPRLQQSPDTHSEENCQRRANEQQESVIHCDVCTQVGEIKGKGQGHCAMLDNLFTQQQEQQDAKPGGGSARSKGLRRFTVRVEHADPPKKAQLMESPPQACCLQRASYAT